MTAAPALYLHSYSLRFRFAHQPGYDVFAFMQEAARRGFAGVNVSASRPENLRHLGGTTAAHFEAVHAQAAALGLGLDLETRGTAPAHLAYMVQVAAAVGARLLRTYTLHTGTPGEVIDATARDLAAAAAEAERNDVTIVLENHEDLTGGELAEVLQRVDHPFVGALYDYGNSMMVSEEPLVALQAMLPWIRTAHLKDHVVVAGEHLGDTRPWVVGVAVGEGFLPVAEITRRLAAAGVARVAFENVWGYRAPITCQRGRRDDRPVIGEGAFGLLHPPFDDGHCALDVDGIAAGDPAVLLRMEAHALERGLVRLYEAVAAAGIGFAPRRR